MRVKLRFFRGTLTTWQSLFEEAAEFASMIGRERLISISHSEDSGKGVVTVWYWSDVGPAGGEEERKEKP